MNELYPSDGQLNALSGTNDGEQEVLFIATGESPYYTSFYKMLYRLLDVARRAGDLRVYKDGDLTFGVRAGRFVDGPAAMAFAGAAEQALTDNATNYIYLTAQAELAVNTSGFPAVSATPHIALATIAAGTASRGGLSGTYDHVDIVDCRGPAIYSVLRAMTAEAANTLVGGGSSNADGLHVHAMAGLQDAVQDLLPTAGVTFGAESSHKRTITVHVKDGAGNDLTAVHQVRIGIAAAEYAPPSPTDNTVDNIATGTAWKEVTANSAYEFYTDATGTVVFDLTVAAGSKTRYVMAAVGGRVYSSGTISFD